MTDGRCGWVVEGLLTFPTDQTSLPVPGLILPPVRQCCYPLLG